MLHYHTFKVHSFKIQLFTYRSCSGKHLEKVYHSRVNTVMTAPTWITFRAVTVYVCMLQIIQKCICRSVHLHQTHILHLLPCFLVHPWTCVHLMWTLSLYFFVFYGTARKNCDDVGLFIIQQLILKKSPHTEMLSLSKWRKKKRNKDQKCMCGKEREKKREWEGLVYFYLGGRPFLFHESQF